MSRPLLESGEPVEHSLVPAEEWPQRWFCPHCKGQLSDYEVSFDVDREAEPSLEIASVERVRCNPCRQIWQFG